MPLRVPFFGLISPRSPMLGLISHYELITKALSLMTSALAHYQTDGLSPEFVELHGRMDGLEEEADKVKRHIRNHLPRGLFMPVDRTLFFNYTRAQDDILDHAQDAMNWLAMRPMAIPDDFRGELAAFLSEVSRTVDLLRPALDSTIELVHASRLDRQDTKERFRDVRSQHRAVYAMRISLRSRIYNSELGFKDIHQLSHVVQCLFEMSHKAEGCADMLRAMIAR